jgi:hypothetical protein
MLRSSSLLLVVSLLAAAAMLSQSTPNARQTPGWLTGSDHLAGFPHIILWAWERPEELKFIDPHEVGVAFLAGTLYLRSEKVMVHPRLQPLQVADGTALMAVVRIETDQLAPPQLSPNQQTQTVSAITKLTRLPSVAALQVDFDAKASERAFYRSLLHELRQQLPDTLGLSITALASWCLHDNWLADLPVDEAVPMLFRMGADHQQVLLHLQAGKDFRSAMCRHSLGIATDEPLPNLPTGRRVYLFHPHSWSAQVAHDTITEVKQWQ